LPDLATWHQLSTGLLAGVKAGHVRLCRVAGNTVILYGKWRPVAVRWNSTNSYTLLYLLPFNWATFCSRWRPKIWLRQLFGAFIANFGLLFESVDWRPLREWKLANFGLLFASVWCHKFRKIWQPSTYLLCAIYCNHKWTMNYSCSLPNICAKWVDTVLSIRLQHGPGLTESNRLGQPSLNWSEVSHIRSQYFKFRRQALKSSCLNRPDLGWKVNATAWTK